jgi:hypothetical protein
VTVFTKSQWFYGHTVTIDNRSIDFSRDAVDYTGFINVGSYTLTDFAQAVARAMNSVDEDNNYQVSVDRTTRQLTITGADEFELLVTTGVSVLTSAFPLIGFTANQTGASSYQGGASGKVFIPQLRIQSYTPFELDQIAADSVINESASGRIEAVSFGKNRFMTCNIRYQTNKPTGFTEGTNGINELREFLEYATTKADLEFMPNTAAPNTFFKCVLESTARSSAGTGFRLEESDGIPGFYDSGRLVFRERT